MTGLSLCRPFEGAGSPAAGACLLRQRLWLQRRKNVVRVLFAVRTITEVSAITPRDCAPVSARTPRYGERLTSPGAAGPCWSPRRVPADLADQRPSPTRQRRFWAGNTSHESTATPGPWHAHRRRSCRRTCTAAWRAQPTRGQCGDSRRLLPAGSPPVACQGSEQG
jgi:hypothetical protein